MFLPDAARGRALDAAIRKRLAGSFDHLLDACRPHIALDTVRLRWCIDRIAAADRVRPEVFVVHRDCVVAAAAGDLPAVSGAFAALAGTPVTPDRPFGPRAWGDDSFSAAEAVRYGWAFGAEGDTPVTLAAPDPVRYARAASCLSRALDALGAADPALHDEILALVTEVVFADDAGGDGATFDGVTAFYAYGAVLMNAAEHQTVPDTLATLVHEAAHCLMFAATEGRPLVDNPPGDRFPSPLRTDARPMNGVVHATVVAARMAYALDRVAAAGSLPATDDARASALQQGARRAFAAGRDTVRRHAMLTDVGARFMDGAEAYMATAPSA